ESVLGGIEIVGELVAVLICKADLVARNELAQNEGDRCRLVGSLGYRRAIGDSTCGCKRSVLSVVSDRSSQNTQKREDTCNLQLERRVLDQPTCNLHLRQQAGISKRHEGLQWVAQDKG